EALVQGGKNLRVLEIPIAFRDRECGTSKMSLGVAFLFALRWIVAMAKRPFRGHRPAVRFDRQSSSARPAKRNKVANNALPSGCAVTRNGIESASSASAVPEHTSRSGGEADFRVNRSATTVSG